ncbi:hypothetical protein PoMZ_08592, partial [Pyricularia oryzae]
TPIMKWLLVFTLGCSPLGVCTKLGFPPTNTMSISNRITRNNNIASSATTHAPFPGIIKRGTIASSCIGWQKEYVEECLYFAASGYHAIKDDENLRQTFFKTNSKKHIKMIQKVYSDIEQACDPSKSPDYVFNCGGDECPNGHMAYAKPDGQTVYLCPPFWEYGVKERGHTLIHELTHLKTIRGTNDFETNGYEESIALP